MVNVTAVSMLCYNRTNETMPPLYQKPSSLSSRNGAEPARGGTNPAQPKYNYNRGIQGVRLLGSRKKAARERFGDFVVEKFGGGSACPERFQRRGIGAAGAFM